MTRIVAALASVALAAAPAAAHNGTHTGDEWPLVAAATQPQGWASFKLQTDGSRFALQLHNGGFTQAVSLGVAVYREDGSPISAAGLTVYYATTQVYADGDRGALHVEEMLDRYSSASGGGGMTATITPPGPGVLKVLAWGGARPLKDWSYTLRGEGLELLAQEAGDGAFLYQSNDFSGVAQAKVSAGGAGVRISSAVHKIIEVRDTLFAWYLQPAVAACCGVPQSAMYTQANLMSVTTPSGERDCTLGCTIWSFAEADRAGPGTYSFNLTGAGAGVITDTYDVSIIGTDARLPA